MNVNLSLIQVQKGDINLSTSKDLKTTKEIVKSILIHEPQTRNCNGQLLCSTYRAIANKKDIDIKNMSVVYFLNNLSELGLPSPESVTRVRRLIQNEFPELKADDDIEAMRMMNEEVYRDFAIHG